MDFIAFITIHCQEHPTTASTTDVPLPAIPEGLRRSISQFNVVSEAGVMVHAKAQRKIVLQTLTKFAKWANMSCFSGPKFGLSCTCPLGETVSPQVDDSQELSIDVLRSIFTCQWLFAFGRRTTTSGSARIDVWHCFVPC